MFLLTYESLLIIKTCMLLTIMTYVEHKIQTLFLCDSLYAQPVQYVSNEQLILENEYTGSMAHN